MAAWCEACADRGISRSFLTRLRYSRWVMALPPKAGSGLGASITRRDFLNGVPIAVGAAAGAMLPEFISGAVADGRAPLDAIGYPPAATGLRGDHPGSFETAHALRDPAFWAQAGPVSPTGEDYDLVVVGGGISGLAAAHFYRARHDPLASSSSITMTISAVMPSVMNLPQAAAWR